MLGRVQTCLTLLSLNRSLDKRLQFLGIGGGGEDGAVAVDEEQSTILSAVLMEHAELVVKVNEAGPGEGVTLDGFAHGIGGFEFVGEAEHVQTTIAVLVVDGDDVAGVADAGRAPRGPANDERQLILVRGLAARLLCAHRSRCTFVRKSDNPQPLARRYADARGGQDRAWCIGGGKCQA